MGARGIARDLAALVLRLGLPALLLAITPTAASAAGGVALVIGNASYASLPPVQACLTSAHAVAAALRGLAFTVVEREDASAGEMDAALSSFTAAIQQQGSPVTVIYACGYGTGFNQRSFLLPVSATISRPADVLTQGVLTRSILGTIGQARAGASLAVLDVVPLPGGEHDLGLASLAQADLPPQLGLLAATDTPAGITPTPVANALVSALKTPPPAAVAAVLQAVAQAAGGAASVHIAALRAPAAPETLTAAAAPPAPAGAPATPRVPPPASTGTPAAAPPAVRPAPATGPAPAAPAPGAPAATTAAAMPDQDHMNDSDRRTVQSALARLGYYDGRIDGIFGPDTLAAIRRWQFELHMPMTGHLTAAEANRLVGR